MTGLTVEVGAMAMDELADRVEVPDVGAVESGRVVGHVVTVV